MLEVNDVSRFTWVSWPGAKGITITCNYDFIELLNLSHTLVYVPITCKKDSVHIGLSGTRCSLLIGKY